MIRMEKGMIRLNTGDYQPKSYLGQGGMAETILAVNTLNNMDVVLKKVKGDLFRNKNLDEINELSQRLVQEGLILQNMDHSNIVKVHGAILDGGDLKIVMEYVSGRTLEAMLPKILRFNVGARMSLIYQLCNAIAYANRKGVMHRDLKPANMMVTKDWVLKVLDFGIAKLNGINLTQHSGSMLTPSYCAPEQILSHPSHCMDVFSTAVIAYQVLTGEHPFKASKMEGYIHNIMSAPYQESPNIAKLPVNIKAWKAVFKKALAKKPEDRFDSTTAFFGALLSCFKVQQREDFTHRERFRMPTYRLKKIDQLDEVRDMSWKAWLKQLHKELKSNDRNIK